jgi:hypothetical protein
MHAAFRRQTPYCITFGPGRLKQNHFPWPSLTVTLTQLTTPNQNKKKHEAIEGVLRHSTVVSVSSRGGPEQRS